MTTYQDLLRVGERDEDKMPFVRAAISKYTGEDFYKTADVAYKYDKKRNPDIEQMTKEIYTISGKRVPDTYSSNYKIGRAFFPYFVLQEVQYLLGNGVSWQDKGTADKLGTKEYPFDTKLQEAGHAAIVGGCAYGFWNLDHVEVFSALEFVPMYDEENGALRAGIRFWQVDASKPLRATLYEEDGYTDYIWNRRLDDEKKSHEYAEVLHEKRAYVITSTGTEVDGDKIYNGENYPSFPIVPLWANDAHQSEIVGLREQIFCYDVIRSGFANTVEDASFIFWSIHNAPGMDDVDLMEFLRRVREHRVALTEDSGSQAVPERLETPYQSRSELLSLLERDIFKDAMAFDPQQVAGGAVTATQITAAYDNLELKVNRFEYCVIDFIRRIMTLAGVDDEPTFTRARNINMSEEINCVLSAAQVLDSEYVTRKVLTLLGDGDQADELIERREVEEVEQARARLQVIDQINNKNTEDEETENIDEGFDEGE